MMNILLTGATGFVGRQVLNSLAEYDVNVTLIVRDGKENLVKKMVSVNRVITTPDLFEENIDWLVEACKNIDTIIHVAWYAEPGKYLHSPKNMDCLTGTLNLAKAAGIAGVKRFIGVGTCFEYDLKGGVLSIETPLKPITPYAASKTAAYMALSQYFSLTSIEFAWCRLFYLYGEGEDKRRLVPYLRTKLNTGEKAELTSGKQIRDFMNVKAAGAAISKVAFGNHIGPLNICSGVPVTVRQLAEKVADEYGRRDLLEFGARADNSVDPPCVLGIRSDI